MGNMKDSAESVRGDRIPHLAALRRVPLRYRQMVPLPMMKRLQCLVIGSAQGVLTVAMTDRHNTHVIEVLQRYTGQTIFPVLIEPRRMRLLLHRIERSAQWRCLLSAKNWDAWKRACYHYTRHRLEVNSLVMFLSSQKMKR